VILVDHLVLPGPRCFSRPTHRHHTSHISHDFAGALPQGRCQAGDRHSKSTRPGATSSFFATYKKELIHTRPWADLKSLLEVTVEWIKNYYNTVRRHSTLGYLTPREYELGFRNLNHLAA
jgi:putative transposase